MTKFVDSITRKSRLPAGGKEDNFGIPIPVSVGRPIRKSQSFLYESASRPPSRGITVRRSFQFLAGLILTIGLIGIGLNNPTIAHGIDLYRLAGDGRYLILFQNNTELRPTGGFLGSFAVAEIKNKRLDSFEIETNIYHKDDQFIKNFYVAQPKPFEDWLPNKSWSLHDSNWEADFSRATQDIKWFYETEYQDKIDGVVAINASVLSDILKFTGPIELPDFQMTLSHNNALARLQEQIDLNYYKTTQGLVEDKPKTILANLFPILKKKIGETSKLKFIQLIQQELKQKDILFYFEDNRQEIVEQNQWGGRINEENSNYLHINNANIGGGKSSLSTKQEVEYRLENGKLVLTITRTNLPRTDGFPTHTNFNYTRIYLPKGVLLKKWQGENEKGEPISKIDQRVEFNRNVFGFWFNTPLQESRTVRLTFQLPAFGAYQNLLIQKQPGAKNEIISVTIDGDKIFEGELTKNILLKSTE